MPKYQVTLYRPVTDYVETTVTVETEATEISDIVTAAVEKYRGMTSPPEWNLSIEGHYDPIEPEMSDETDVVPVAEPAETVA